MDADDNAAGNAVHTCLTCRKRRRACSKDLPQCERCAGNGLDCVYRLGGLLRSAFAGYPRDPSLPTADEAGSAVFPPTEILFNGVVRPFAAAEEAKSSSTKRACVLCHAAKRSCSDSFPCDRCVRQGLNCVEYVTGMQWRSGTARESSRTGLRSKTTAASAQSRSRATADLEKSTSISYASVKSEGQEDSETDSGPSLGATLTAEEPGPEELGYSEQHVAETSTAPAPQSISDLSYHRVASNVPSKRAYELEPEVPGGTAAPVSARIHGPKRNRRSADTMDHNGPGPNLREVPLEVCQPPTSTARVIPASPLPLPLLRSVPHTSSATTISSASFHASEEDEEGIPLKSYLSEDQLSSLGDLVSSLSFNGTFFADPTSGQPVSLADLVHRLLPDSTPLSVSSSGSNNSYSDEEVNERNALTLASAAVQVRAATTTVPNFFSPFPATQTLPNMEITGSLIKTFKRAIEDIYPYLHRSVFANLLRNDRTLVSAMCLAAFHASEEPEITGGNSIQLQHRLFVQTMTGITGVLDKYLDDRDGSRDDEERMDALCETLFSLGMVAFWASNCGQVQLFSQVVDVAFRMMFRIGLHHEPRGQFGRTTPREAWIRRHQRRFLWWCLSYTVFFSNHWTHNDRMKKIIAATDKMTVPLFPGFLWRAQSETGEFEPSIYDPYNLPFPSLLGRPVLYGDLFSWINLPVGSVERQKHLELVGSIIFSDDRRYDTRFSYVLEYVHYNIRGEVTSFLLDCREAGVSPGELVALAEGRPGIINKVADWTKLAPLLERRQALEQGITDFLAAMPGKIKAAEESGDYGTILQYLSDADELAEEGIDIDAHRDAAHAQVLYFIDLRAMKVELRTSFGLLTFAEIAQGKMDGEFVDSPSFRECLKDAVIFTRHIRSLLNTPWPLSFDVYHTGLNAPKIGAFHLALLSHFLRKPHTVPPGDGGISLLRGLKSDLDVCLRYVDSMAPEKRPKGSKMWQATIRKVFTKLVNNLEGSPRYRQFFGLSPFPYSLSLGSASLSMGTATMSSITSPTSSSADALSALDAAPLSSIDVEIAHLRRDVAIEDEELVGGEGAEEERPRWDRWAAELNEKVKGF